MNCSSPKQFIYIVILSQASFYYINAFGYRQSNHVKQWNRSGTVMSFLCHDKSGPPS